ncbi:hypothetical protein KKF91_16550 [Myxococcota bacterium]|nr:hypothetical protein [Myxococcota bacterium]
MSILIINTDPGFSRELYAAFFAVGLHAEVLSDEAGAAQRITSLGPRLVILGQLKAPNARKTLTQRLLRLFPDLPLLSIAEQGELGDGAHLDADLYRPFLLSALLEIVNAHLNLALPCDGDHLVGQERPQSLLGPQSPSSSVERAPPVTPRDEAAIEELDGSTLSVNERSSSGKLVDGLDLTPASSMPEDAPRVAPTGSPPRPMGITPSTDLGADLGQVTGPLPPLSGSLPPSRLRLMDELKPSTPVTTPAPAPMPAAPSGCAEALAQSRAEAEDRQESLQQALAGALRENERLSARNQEMKSRLERARAEAEKTYSEIRALHLRAKSDLEKTRAHYQALLADRDAAMMRMGEQHEIDLAALRAEQDAALALMQLRQKVHSQSVEMEQQEAEAARQEDVFKLRDLHEADRVAQERRHEAAEDALREAHRRELARVEREKRALEERVEALEGARAPAAAQDVAAQLMEAERRQTEALATLDAEWRARYETQEARYLSRIEALFDIPEEVASADPSVARLRQEHERLQAAQLKLIKQIEGMRAERDQLRADLNHLRVHVVEGRDALSKLKIALNAAHVIVTSDRGA